mgnify:FL=1
MRDGKLDPESDEALNFAVELGLIGEHTQGMDIKTHLRNWDKYDMDKFIPARKELAFQRVEQSWKEIDDYIGLAIAYLPEHLRNEAWEKIEETEKISIPSFTINASKGDYAPWQCELLDGNLRVGGLCYQMFDSNDYKRFLKNYLRNNPQWALEDLSKIGLEDSRAVSVSLPALTIKREERNEKKGKRFVYELSFPYRNGVDGRCYPEKMYVNTLSYKNGKRAELEVTFVNKPAVRLPEAYWLSFNATDIVSLVAEKVGRPVDLLDVVKKGNRQMHGIDRFVDIVTSQGTIRIWSKDAFLVNIGEPCGLNYSLQYPDKRGGIHFNLGNNLWNTNFSMWWEGSITYRFVIELLTIK